MQSCFLINTRKNDKKCIDVDDNNDDRRDS